MKTVKNTAKKSRTMVTVPPITPMSGRGVAGDPSDDTETAIAARPKNKSTTGETTCSTEATGAGRAKTKTRKRRGGGKSADTDDVGAATKQRLGDECCDGTDDRVVAQASSNGTTGDPWPDADTRHAGRAKSKRRGGEGSNDTDTRLATPAKPKRGRGEAWTDTDIKPAASAQTNGHATGALTPKVSLRGPAGEGDCQCDTESSIASTCLLIRELQRQAVYAMASRIATNNRMTMCVAIAIGFSGGLEDEERKRIWNEACKLIKCIKDGTEVPDEYKPAVQQTSVLVLTLQTAHDGFLRYEKDLEKKMVVALRTLPICEWLSLPNQHGVGELSIARVIGETGDLSNYSGPAKVWKRLGLAPYNGKMPSTWRSSKPSLHAAEWTELGYCPRRRSVVWNLVEPVYKGNKGTYRQRFEEAKARFFITHPGCSKGHANNHAKLLCGKEVIKQLWRAWNGYGAEEAAPKCPR